jgi:hypothetical protein
MEIVPDHMVNLEESRRFRVALSFPGEHRELVEKIADGLAANWEKEQILYDEYHRAEFARPNLNKHLQNLYKNDSDLIVVFICADYQNSTWCGIEWRAISELMSQTGGSERIMFIRCGTGTVDGVFDSVDGYIDSNKVSVDEIVSDIIKRHSMIVDAQNTQTFFDICKEIVKSMKEDVENEGSYFYLSGRENVKFLFDNGLYLEPEIETKFSLNANKPVIVIGDGGHGKSLFLIKKFIEAAEEFLNNSVWRSDIIIPFYCRIRNLKGGIKTISDFVKKSDKTYEKYFSGRTDFKIAFYLDGLDEMKDEIKRDFEGFVETDIFKSSVLITCRGYFYDEKIHELPNFSHIINIKNWDEKDTRKFIEKYCGYNGIDNNTRGNAINFICGKNKDIFSPFLISLFLYIIKKNPLENWNDKSQIEVSILNSAMEEYMDVEVRGKGDSITPTDIVVSIISEACRLHYYYNHAYSRGKEFTYSESYRKKIHESLGIDENIVDKYIKIVLKKDMDTVELTAHEKIYEFLIAKRIVSLIVEGNKERDNIFYMNYKHEIFWYVVSLCKYYDDNDVKVSEFCKESYMDKFKSANFNDYKDLIYLINCVIVFARSAPAPEEFIEKQLNDESLEKEKKHAIRFALYDSIIQYSKKPLIRQEYEEIFYNNLLSDDSFEKIHRGSRLVYYNCKGASVDYIIAGDKGNCDWRVLFDEIKKHFKEKNHDGKHYISRRIELITIKKLLGVNHINNENPAFKEDLKTFLSEVKLELYEKAKKGDPFDIKVKECYDLCFSDFGI